MKTIHIIILSIVFSVVFKGKFNKESFVRSLMPKAAPITCEEISHHLSGNILTLKIDFKNDRFRDCVNKAAESKNFYVLASAEEERKIIDEMINQTAKPIASESVIEIGKMLAPSHILSLKSKVDFKSEYHFSLVEIKTAKVVSTFKLSETYYDQNSELIFKIIYQLYIFLFFLIFLKLINIPLKKRIDLIDARHDSFDKFQSAMNLIRSENIYDGVNELITVANDGVYGGASNKAYSELMKIKESLEN